MGGVWLWWESYTESHKLYFAWCFFYSVVIQWIWDGGPRRMVITWKPSLNRWTTCGAMKLRMGSSRLMMISIKEEAICALCLLWRIISSSEQENIEKIAFVWLIIPVYRNMQDAAFANKNSNDYRYKRVTLLINAVLNEGTLGIRGDQLQVSFLFY